jgi:hypothetical protein
MVDPKTYCARAAQGMGCARPSNRPVSTQRGLSHVLARAMQACAALKPYDALHDGGRDHVAPSAVAEPPHQPLMVRSLLLLLRLLGLLGLGGRGRRGSRAVGPTASANRLGGGSSAERAQRGRAACWRTASTGRRA